MNDMPKIIENRIFEEISPGDSAKLTHRLTLRDFELFAALASGADPSHVDTTLAASRHFRELTGEGVFISTLFTTLLGAELPGLGTHILHEDFSIHAAVKPDEPVTATVIVEKKDANAGTIRFRAEATNALGKKLVTGAITVRAPTEKLRRPADGRLNDIVIEARGVKFRQLIVQAEKLDPIETGVVHPVEPNAIKGAVEAAEGRLIVPVFIGPADKIRAAADHDEIDITAFELVNVEHSHAAADMAARMAHEGKLHALMKGSLHTDEFLRPILTPEYNLHTDHRLSHVFLMDVPSYPKLLLITDGAINISPDLAIKKEIVENAIGMAHALRIDQPRVAILSAVEVVNPKIPSTLDAAALCKMAERGQISGAILDGPLAFDNAISKLAAEIKHIVSDVAGQADILLAPDLDAGNMIAKQLEYMASAEAAGVVLGARIPIILTSRADSAQSRKASCAVAALIHAHGKAIKT
jgi:phosphate acetyltransferase